ncbi:MAG: alpha/beta fold hydrolase, partial [Burkholderiaceae bacterium]
LSRPMLQPAAGGWQLHYDPAIGHAFANMPVSMDAAAQAAEQALWAMYDAIGCPTLLLRGEHSDLLAPATAEAMTRRGPCATLRTVPDVGHAPTLVDATQVQWVSDFLLAHST